MRQLLRNDFEPIKQNFQGWVNLEILSSKVQKAIAQADYVSGATLICQYVSIAFCIKLKKVEKLSWENCITLYYKGMKFNHIGMDLPMFKYPIKEIDDYPWDYEDREWISLTYTLAREFGWSYEYIADLDPIVAMKFIQEIEIRSQFDREWQWTLSEKSVIYNKDLKKSEFKPLTRPSWMIRPPKELKPVKIRPEFLPVGNIISYRNKTDVIH